MTVQSTTTRVIPVWDLPTRLFHWTLVTLVVVLYVTSELSIEWHMRAGQAVLTLVLFRLVWGFIGSGTSRFAAFLAGPHAGLAHLREVLALAKGETGLHRPSLGHTPLGGWMIVALLALLAVQAGTGLFASDDIATDGPLVHLVTSHQVKLLTTIHKLVFDLLAVGVGVHVSAALFYLFRAHDNLIRPMLTGIKELPADVPGNAPRLVNPWLAAGVLAVAAGVVALVVRL